MEVILLEKINKLGVLGQQVRVKPGYGRNFLIPTGKAVAATRDNIEKFEARRAQLELEQANIFEKAKIRSESLSGLTVTLKRKAGTEGKLYGSVGTADIAGAVSESGMELSKHEVRLAEGPFRAVGEYEVSIALHADVNTTVRVVILPEEE